METTTGFLSLALRMARHSCSLASDDPPGEFTRSTMARTASSSAACSIAAPISSAGQLRVSGDPPDWMIVPSPKISAICGPLRRPRRFGGTRR